MKTLRRLGWRRVAFWALVGGVALFALIQAVPYGRKHSNPPVTQEPRWDSPRTRELAVNACFDCHSNQTKWRWYSNVAPVSWLVQRDVDGGRAKLNFSTWDRPQGAADEILEAIESGEMPPWYYTPLHSRASLTAGEKSDLLRGLSRTLSGSR